MSNINKKIGLVLLLLPINFCFAANIKQNLTFINCSGQNVQISNPTNPYKFSLNGKIATNGYSMPVSFLIGKNDIIYNYPFPLMGFYNGFVDAQLSLQFTGGVNGTINFVQVYPVHRNYETISVSSSTAAIKIYPDKFNSLGDETNEGTSILKVIIAMGCNN